MSLLRCLLPAAISLALACSSLLAADGVERVEVSRDAWISAYPSEQEGNNGGSHKLKLKGIQEFFLIDFDPKPYAGRRVASAKLHLHGEGEETLGRVSVSTIVDQWVEGTGNGYEKQQGASSFLWAETGQRRWSVPPISGDDAPSRASDEICHDITGVVLGLGGSIWGFADATPRDQDGWQSVAIDPAVVQARLDGKSFGFFVIDDVGNEYSRDGNRFEYHLMPNRFFSSSESSRSRAPYFTLRFAGEESAKPDELADRSQPQQSDVELSSPASQVNRLAMLLDMELAAEGGNRPAAEKSAVIGLEDLFGEPLSSDQLHCARGEAICLFVDARRAADVSVMADEQFEVRVYDTPTVAGHIDPLVPANSAKPPQADLGESGKVLVEIYVEKAARAGRHALQLKADDLSDTLSLHVWDFTLPDHLSFLPQMNCYGLPGHELKYMRMAHEHRTVLNQLRYGWTGKVDSNAVPRIAADGSWDWTEWDARFGPLFDGTAFDELRRPGVPIEAFYLPLNENWPMDHEQHFRGGYWIEDAYGEAYWQQFRESARRFTEHFQQRQWDDTMFEFYMNNKVYFKRTRDNRWDGSSAAWIFDEPVNTQDFWALRRFGLEYWRGVDQAVDSNARDATGEPKRPAMTFRVDISRPQWQRQLLDGISNVDVVSGALRTYHERVIDRARKFDNLVYMYGSANKIGTPNVMPAAWCVETWALGGDGVVPWQTIGTEQSWKQPDQLSLFYPTADGPLPSVRLKAFRAGQQLAEYLTLYCKVTGADRDIVGKELLAAYSLSGTTQKRSEADAGDSLFEHSSAQSLRLLRHKLGTWLDQQAPPADERLIDLHPPLRDPQQVTRIEVVAVP